MRSDSSEGTKSVRVRMLPKYQARDQRPRDGEAHGRAGVPGHGQGRLGVLSQKYVCVCDVCAMYV